MKSSEEADNEDEIEELIRIEKNKMNEEEIRRLLEDDCEECGKAVRELELCLLGLDVTALFPSMSARRTGEIVRTRMMKSRMNVEGFDWTRTRT